MDKYLQECYISNLKYTGSILPFFWQHGEDHETLAKEMDAIKRSGATEFCVESRTHEEFCREKWWEDFRFMLDYAKANDMKVWLLDDKRFPSGYANGYIAEHPELRRRVISVDYRDFTGPTFKTQICPIALKPEYDEKYVSITAWKRDRDFRTILGEPINLLDKINASGLIDWDVPAGTWRVYYVIDTLNVRNFRPEYIDMLSPESCKAMLHAVYEPHYEHFSEYFGTTFVGFFSDEPSFANSNRSYNHKLGTEDLLLPWREDLPELIAEEIGSSAEKIRLMLPALWHELPGLAPAVRVGYMDLITRLYSKNFTQMIGAWCKERDVLYIGHIIEDNNAHQRLGYGPGHIFRALKGQHMSGVDIVLNQMIPGNLDTQHIAPVSGKMIDPTFFHYALAKLGASCAHINPEMENRAMAEVFGAFGWAEGVGYMKYLADHMLVSGINYFVPHAYSPKYPDRDCPPHFYAHGLNPQEKAYGMLTRYMQRIARLTADSVHQADVAVFYNAEAEWAGGELELFQEVCKQLAIRQVDYDIIPEDALESAGVKGRRLFINKESYAALLVPYSEILPKKIVQCFAGLQKQGLPVIFVDIPCKITADGIPAKDIMENMAVIPSVLIANYVRSKGWAYFSTQQKCPGLRVYRVDRKDNSVYLLFNESKELVDTVVEFEGCETCVIYEGWQNKLYQPEIKDGGIRIKLAYGQALALITNQLPAEVNDRAADKGRYTTRPNELDINENSRWPLYNYDKSAEYVLDMNWNISVCDAGCKEYRELYGVNELVPFNTPHFEPRFCGTIRYEASFVAKGDETVLDLGCVGEIATLYLNGIDCGTQVAAPYVFDITNAIAAGVNKLVIEVVNSPVYREKEYDRYVTYHPMPTSGMLGPVKIG